MSRLLFLFRLLILLELMVGAGLVAWRLTRLRPPYAELSRLDVVTAAEVEKIRRDIWVDTAESWRRLAEAYLVCGFFPDAQLCFQHASQLDPASPVIHFQWALALDRMGRMSEAIDQLNTFNQLIVGNQALVESSWYLMGRIHLRQEDAAAAKHAFQKAPNNTLAAYELARILVRDGQIDKAVQLLDKVLAKHPAAYEPKLLRARVERMQGNREVADRLERQADRANRPLFLDTTSQYLIERRVQYGLHRDIDKGQQLAEAGRLHEAIEPLSRALKLEWNPLILKKLALIELQLAESQLDRARHAEELLEMLIERDGPSTAALERAGYARVLLGDEEGARELWEQAMRMQPTKELCNNLATYYLHHGHQELAQNYRAQKNHLEGKKAFYNGDLSVALRAFQETVRLEPERSHAWYYLGQVYSELEKFQPAQKAFERCLTIDPYHGRAREELARISTIPNR